MDNTIKWDEPTCGFDGRKCPREKKYNVLLVVVYILVAMVPSLLVTIVLFYKIWAAESKITGLQWRISTDELKSLNSQFRGSMVGI